MESHTKDRKIVVVDDVNTFTKFIKILLDDEGYNVEIFNEPEKAFEYIVSNGAHILLTDYSMPQMNGIELIKLVKKHNPEIKCMLMSSDIAHAKNATAGDYIFIDKNENFAENIIDSLRQVF